MRREIYGNLILLCNRPSLQDGAKAAYEISQAIRRGNTDSVCMSVKDYKIKYGLSNHLFRDFESKDNLYEVYGPMGMGLDVQKKGIHVAFSAGTGILVFIDIVAHLILRLLEENGYPNIFGINTKGTDIPRIDMKKFKFVLFSSFSCDEESICLPLIDSLKQLCRKFDRPFLFEHHSRISNQTKSPQRWDKKFFSQTIQNMIYSGAKKIWVCGPPIMNEYCERAVYEMPKAE
mmetsp:Transcript_10565/g.17727  ORF Transcript_10565/g.17727 Transcript_10565/m.17727 type:complete len:232 (-) Transcript_10565:65-760(-)